MKSEKSKMKIALADDHILLRNALKDMILLAENNEVIFTANNGNEVIQNLKSGRIPDVLILDLNMPEKDGFETMEWIYLYQRDVKTLILTMYDSETALLRLLQSGARGFLKKDISPHEFMNAIRSVHENGYYYNSSVAGKLVNLFSQNRHNYSSSLESSFLNELEIEFLKHVSTDLTYKEIAAQMKVNPRTIDSYRDSLFDKLNVRSRVGLAIYALKNGIVRL